MLINKSPPTRPRFFTVNIMVMQHELSFSDVKYAQMRCTEIAQLFGATCSVGHTCFISVFTSFIGFPTDEG